MKLISQSDWDVLNAYSDGELPDADVVDLEARLRAEPALQQTLEQIQGVGLALRPLRPEVVSTPERHRMSRWSYKHVAIAASVALVLAISGALFLKPTPGHSPTDLHQAYLQQPFDVSQGGMQRVNSRAGLPDLASADLTLVADVTENTDIRALHYAGRNGCRLTLTIAGGSPPDIKAASDLLLASWKVNSANYTLLATGMDSNRFAAITDFVRDYFEQQAQPTSVMAMRDATETAVPCNIG